MAGNFAREGSRVGRTGPQKEFPSEVGFARLSYKSKGPLDRREGLCFMYYLQRVHSLPLKQGVAVCCSAFDRRYRDAVTTARDNLLNIHVRKVVSRCEEANGNHRVNHHLAAC
jgi:hypothetical protein